MNDNQNKILVWKQPVLYQKNIVVTGGTSGIGFAIANTCLYAGCEKIVITGRNEKKLKEAIDKLRKEHPEKAECVLGSLLDLESIKDFQEKFNEIISIFGQTKVNIWINNAGIYFGTRFGNVSEKEWDSLMNTNLKAQYFICQIVANYMIDQKIKGNILNICSSSSYRPSIDPYMISKLGMSGLTLGMAKKLISHGIVVNGIAPGPTFTPMLNKKEGDSLEHGGVPAGRYILPQEVANLAVFLISPMGRMIVGDVVKITGGSAVVTFDDVNY